MLKDRLKWNEKYRQKGYPAEASDIVNILFLNRRLFPQIRAGLRPGGLLIFETLLEPPEGTQHAGHCRDFFLKENELLHSFLSLRILHYREEPGGGQDSSRLLASLVAMRNN
jgi:hypothetical protein